MDVSPQPTQFCAVVSAVDGDTTTVASATDHSIPTHPTVYHKLMKKKNKRKKRAAVNPSSSPSSTSSSACSSQGVLRVRRNPRILVRSNRFEGRDIEAIALPIGMSIAAVITQVLERKGGVGEQMSVDHLSMICLQYDCELTNGLLHIYYLSRQHCDWMIESSRLVTCQLWTFRYCSIRIGGTIGALRGEVHQKWWDTSVCTLAVRKSLSNVFGNKFENFIRSFETSFNSTLKTLQLINDTSLNKEKHCSSHSSAESSTLGVTPLMSCNKNEVAMSNCIQDCQFEVNSSRARTWEQSNTLAEVQESMQTGSVNRELALCGEVNEELAFVPPSRLRSANHSMLSTFGKSVEEQTRANDLKATEISLLIRKLQLEEQKLVLDSDSNLLERFKLSMGISKASFKAEKFKSQMGDTRHAELLKKCIDCLVAGLFIMSMSLGYGAYVHSYKRIVEATSFCELPKENKSWWIPKPMAFLNSGMLTLGCQIQVLSRMLFGGLLILLIAYLLLQRSSTSTHAMPVTFILLILGFACGFAGKVCVDTLGGNGFQWLLYWEALCLVHFFSNVCTSALFRILYGPINASQGGKNNVSFPYWIRRFLFYAIVVLFLPMHCGLSPFASPIAWKDHFILLIKDFMGITSD